MWPRSACQGDRIGRWHTERVSIEFATGAPAALWSIGVPTPHTLPARRTVDRRRQLTRQGRLQAHLLRRVGRLPPHPSVAIAKQRRQSRFGFRSTELRKSGAGATNHRSGVGDVICETRTFGDQTGRDRRVQLAAACGPRHLILK